MTVMLINIKKPTLAIIGILFTFIAFGQSLDINITATMLKTYNVWEKGTDVNFKKIIHESSGYSYNNYVFESFYLVDDADNKVNINSRLENCLDFHCKTTQQIWDAAIITRVLSNLTKNGFNYQLRSEMEDDALEYIQTVKKYDLELNDPYLKTYIYSLVAKIAPAYMVDSRPGSINLIIQQNPSINACCYPNGTIVLNTGLLAALHSEAELVAILSHEIAHFILDHSIQNIIAEQQRQQRAEFWAGLATGITALAEICMAANNDYYIPGAATYGMAVLSTNIATAVTSRLGMDYNHQQEEEADLFAKKILNVLGYDENALATALNRLEAEYVKERNNALYLTSYSHPALINRIKDAGFPTETREKEFEQIISFAVSNVAMMKYSDCRFNQCLPYVCQNIENGVGTTDDYLLKANCLLSTKNSEESNQEVMALINQAKAIDGDNINIYKTEIIATLRLGDNITAQELLNNYITRLDSYNLNDIKSDDYWNTVSNFLYTERRWASQMKLKLSGM